MAIRAILFIYGLNGSICSRQPDIVIVGYFLENTPDIVADIVIVLQQACQTSDPQRIFCGSARKKTLMLCTFRNEPIFL